MSNMSTQDAARVLRVSKSTLCRWIAQGHVRPETVRIGSNAIFLFGERDVEKARAFQRSRHRTGWPPNAETTPQDGAEGEERNEPQP